MLVRNVAVQRVAMLLRIQELPFLILSCISRCCRYLRLYRSNGRTISEYGTRTGLEGGVHDLLEICMQGEPEEYRRNQSG
jgi:hypothetical protein